MRQLAKAKREEFLNTMAGAMLALGGNSFFDDDCQCWELQTPAGLLTVRPIADTTYTVFTRFDVPTEGSKLTDCNPHSGKWNFHFSSEGDPQARAAFAILAIANVVNQKKEKAA